MKTVRALPLTVIGVVALVMVSALIWTGCSSDPATTSPSAGPELAKMLPDQASEVAEVMTVQNQHALTLEAIPGVIGTATGRDEQGRPAILVLTERPGVAGIPRMLDGKPVRPLMVGKPELFAKPEKPGGGKGGGGVNFTKRADRPVPIGYSIGNYNECAAGTFGCAVEKGGNLYVLSNNHVLARQNEGSSGEPIGQPGLYDNKPRCSGYWSDTIASLSDFVRVQTGTNANNTVDAAIAVSNSNMIGCATPSDYYGLPNSTPMEAYVDMPIQKVGRNGRTEGVVIGINTTVTLTYAGASTRFVDQVLTSGGFSKSGDSGSLIVTNDSNANPVALLFAGTNDGYTWGNRIQNVLQALNVSICGK